MLQRVRCSADGAIHQVLDAAGLSTGAGEAGPNPAPEVLALGDPRSMPLAMGPLIVDTTFALVQALPEEPLSGELSDLQVRRMMIADHLAFGALERLGPHDTEGLHALATQFQLTALNTAATGAHS